MVSAMTWLPTRYSIAGVRCPATLSNSVASIFAYTISSFGRVLRHGGAHVVPAAPGGDDPLHGRPVERRCGLFECADELVS
jgi:hypothetical protein